MRRDSEEIRQSQQAAFRARITCDQIERQSIEWELRLRNRRDVRSLRIWWYADVVKRPEDHFSQLSKWPIDASHAVSVVDPSLYRFRRERLVEGISVCL
jgi:hypothetical protein